jgi:hypothetical protein
VDLAALRSYLTDPSRRDGYAQAHATPTNFARLVEMLNDRAGGQTVPRPVVPTTAGLLPLLTSGSLERVIHSALAPKLSDALQVGDSAQLLVLSTAAHAVGDITAAELADVAGYLQGTVATAASDAEAAGLVPWGGTVTRDDVERALA